MVTFRRTRGLLAGILLATATSLVSGACAYIGFVRDGLFELCLNRAYADWLQKQAELLVNEDLGCGAWMMPQLRRGRGNIR
jgi:hypothetical protein